MRRADPERVCAACQAAIDERNKSGYCKRCSPGHAWTPQARANASRGRKTRWARELADPAKRAAAIESGRRLKAAYPGTDAIAAAQPSGVKAAAEQRRGWCPPEYRALDDDLRRQSLPLAERKAAIASQIKVDERRRLAAMSPLDRQLEKLRNGAKLVDRFVKPDRDYGVTLGGVSGL